MGGVDSGRTEAHGTRVTRCLIVDDNDYFVEVVHDMLTRGGFDVVGTARDRTQALRLVAETHPDVALIDLFIDHECGIDLIEEIARMGLTERTRTILISSCHRDDLDAVFQASAADGYLAKLEISPDAVRDILDGDGADPAVNVRTPSRRSGAL